MGGPGRTTAACTYRIPTECCDLILISTDSCGEEISLTTGVILHAKSPGTDALPPAVISRAGKQGRVLHALGYMC